MLLHTSRSNGGVLIPGIYVLIIIYREKLVTVAQPGYLSVTGTVTHIPVYLGGYEFILLEWFYLVLMLSHMILLFDFVLWARRLQRKMQSEKVILRCFCLQNLYLMEADIADFCISFFVNAFSRCHPRGFYDRKPRQERTRTLQSIFCAKRGI